MPRPSSGSCVRKPVSRAGNRGFLGWGYREPDGRKPDPRRAALIGLLVTALLVVGGVYLVHVLRQMSEVQDCAPIARPSTCPEQTLA